MIQKKYFKTSWNSCGRTYVLLACQLWIYFILSLVKLSHTEYIFICRKNLEKMKINKALVIWKISYKSFPNAWKIWAWREIFLYDLCV
jgi:hypothetical protein